MFALDKINEKRFMKKTMTILALTILCVSAMGKTIMVDGYSWDKPSAYFTCVPTVMKVRSESYDSAERECLLEGGQIVKYKTTTLGADCHFYSGCECAAETIAKCKIDDDVE